MRASLAVLAVLAALAALAAAPAAALAAVPADAAEGLAPQYITVLYKGLSGRPLDESLGPFYIPDGQCSGVLDNLMSCAADAAPAGVRVSVRDAAPHPLVALHDSLRRASVLRAPPCAGEASVSVRLACRD